MVENKNRSIVPSRGDPNFFQNLAIQLKLILRLMTDKRVSPLLKVLPVGALIYLVWPADLWPIMPVDDAFVVGLGTFFFFEMCPQDVVEEHRQALRKEIMGPGADDDEIIEGEYEEAPE
jgi:uncharacterized membrane protein YkvA (DUF1232 family)